MAFKVLMDVSFGRRSTFSCTDKAEHAVFFSKLQYKKHLKDVLLPFEISVLTLRASVKEIPTWWIQGFVTARGACNAPALIFIRLHFKITISRTHIITLNIYQRPELCVTRTTITILDASPPKASEIITVLLTVISNWRGSIWRCLRTEGRGTIIVFVLVRTVVVWERLSERDQRRRVSAQVHLRAPQIPGITDCLN